MNDSRLLGCAALLFCGLASAQGYPPPGNYRIDSDSVTTMGTGSASARQTSHIDGATGTVVTSVQTPGQPPQSNTTQTNAPVTWCVKPASAAAAPRNSPFACQVSNARSTSESSSFNAACRSVAMENSFRRLDPKTWEHTMTFQVSRDADPMRSAREAFARAAPHMSPADRAQAEKEMAQMPTQADMDKVKAEARAELEEQIRTGSPEEAETARRVLREMQQATAPGGVVQTTHVTERWTLIGQGC